MKKYCKFNNFLDALTRKWSFYDGNIWKLLHKTRKLQKNKLWNFFFLILSKMREVILNSYGNFRECVNAPIEQRLDILHNLVLTWRLMWTMRRMRSFIMYRIVPRLYTQVYILSELFVTRIIISICCSFNCYIFDFICL